MTGIKTLCALVLYCAIALNSLAFQQTDSQHFEYFMSLAEKDPDRALDYYHSAGKLAKTPLQTARWKQSMASTFIHLSAFDSARYYLHSIPRSADNTKTPSLALEYMRCDINDLYIDYRTGDPSIDIDDLLAKISVLEKVNEQHIVLNRAYQIASDYYLVRREVEEAEVIQNKALQLAQATNDHQTFLRFGNQLGLSALYSSRMKKAKGYFDLCIAQMDKYEIENEAMLRLTCELNLGIYYMSTIHHDSAIYYYQKSWSRLIKMKHSRENQYKKALVKGNMALAYLEHLEFEKCIQYVEEATVIMDDEFKHHPFYSSLLTYAGRASLELKRYADAEQYYLRAMASSKNLEDPSTMLAHCYNQILWFYTIKEDFELANQYVDSALFFNIRLVNGIKTYSNDIELYNTVKCQAKLLNLMPSATISQIDAGFALFKRSLKFVQDHADSRYLFASITPTLADYFQCYSAKFRQTNDGLMLHRMWEIMELNKALKLRNQLKGEYSITYALPEEIRLEEQTLKDSINLVMGAMSPNTFDSTLFKLNRKYEALMDQIEADYPKYALLKEQPMASTYKKRQSLLMPDEGHLSFFDARDSIYLMALFSDKVVYTSIEADTVRTLISSFNEALSQSSAESTEQVSQKIRSIFKIDALLEGEIRHLNIIPDGIIWKLNFAALSIPTANTDSYLGNEYTLSYHYYSDPIKLPHRTTSREEVLALSYHKEESGDLSKNYLTFRSLNQELDNVSLPGTSREVAAISQIWQGDYFFADAANESIFKEKSKDYSILHLAVHGYMNDQFPEYSFLQFASSDSLNDGKLHAYEIYNLDINAELVVISACHSGEGKVEAGEGMMSIGRAFAYAGVQSLLAARWEVPDVSTPALMTYFYEGLKKGMKKSAALQFAQKQFLANDADNITSAPFYWAGFYVIGDDEPIRMNITPVKNLHWWILAGIFCCLSIFWIRKKRAHSSGNYSIL